MEFPDRNYKFESGNLEQWFYREKIFLLNCSLTVQKSKPGSHMEIWKEFTDDVIKFINKNNKNCIYILLGKYSENKKILIDRNEHKNIIFAAHPSPFSAHRGFFGTNIFKKAEEILNKKINWQN